MCRTDRCLFMRCVVCLHHPHQFWSLDLQSVLTTDRHVSSDLKQFAIMVLHGNRVLGEQCASGQMCWNRQDPTFLVTSCQTDRVPVCQESSKGSHAVVMHACVNKYAMPALEPPYIADGPMPASHWVPVYHILIRMYVGHAMQCIHHAFGSRCKILTGTTHCVTQHPYLHHHETPI